MTDRIFVSVPAAAILFVVLAATDTFGQATNATVAVSPTATSTNTVQIAIPAEAVQVEALGIKSLEVIQQNVPLFGKFEVRALVVPAYGNPFDADDVRVDLQLVSPSGKKRMAPGFLYARKVDPDQLDDWRVRFSPDEEGEWEAELIITTPQNDASRSVEFRCLKPGVSAPIRVSRKDPTLFEKADGSYYYPLGYNVCWAHMRDYETHFSKMHQNGQNWSRIWIAAWNYEFEWSKAKGNDGVGRYNLEKAGKLDGVVDLAERYGIYIQMVMHEHCRVATVWNPEWQNNPYNKVHGGPCENPQEFFTNPEAIRLAKNRIRYIVARWGYSSHIMAWELFNEVSLADDFDEKTDLVWHRDMARYIRSIDPQHRMITTSYSGTFNADVFQLPEINYTQLHVYDEDIIEKFIEWNRTFAEFKKPFFIGEFGRSTEDGVDRKDKLGMFMHSGVWAQFMMPSGGGAMSWWWYDLIKPRDLYFRHGVLGEFARGLDRRGVNWNSQVGRAGKDAKSPRVLALSSPKTVLAWAYDPTILPYTAKLPDVMPELGGELVLENLTPGKWTVQRLEPFSMRVPKAPVRRSEKVGADGKLKLPLKGPGPDVAFRLEFAGSDVISKSPSFVLEPFEGVADQSAPRAQLRIRRGEIKLDGDLSEWSNFEFTLVDPRDGRKSADNSFKFAVARDAENLYVACDVIDDQVVREKKGENLWKDDCVELWIDAKRNATKISNMPTNPGLYQINFAPPAKDGGAVETVIFRNPGPTSLLKQSLRASSRRTATGYTMEIAIPLATLRGDAAQKPEMGFNITICDADKKDGKTTWHHMLWVGKKEEDATQWSEATLE